LMVVVVGGRAACERVCVVGVQRGAGGLLKRSQAALLKGCERCWACSVPNGRASSRSEEEAVWHGA
jgi:hypothetical protein